MKKDSWKSEPADFWAVFKNCHTIGTYNLTLYCMQGNGEQSEGSLRQCGSIIQNPLCNEMVMPFLDKQIKNAMESERPLICRLHGGLLSFLVPFRSDSTIYCLVGEGVREKSISLQKIEALSKTKKTDPFGLMKQLAKLPVKTYEEVEEDARQVSSVLLSIQEGKDRRSEFDKAKNQLSGVMRSLSQMDELKTVEDVCSLSGKLFGTLFNFPKIAFAIREEEKRDFRIRGVWGLPEDIGGIPEDKLSLFIPPSKFNKEIKFGDDLKHFFPGVTADHIICFPLESHDEFLGYVALFDAEVRHLDGNLVELTASRVASKLMQLKKERDHLAEGALASSLKTITNTLLSAESKEQLYENLLETAVDLVGAARGSIMLVDETTQNLRIGFSKGMTHQLAQTITVKVGEGIAGKVASNGIPMLVEDIDRDPRVAISNRPRFRTKSLLCMPLKLKDSTIGVINLSDKKNLKAFTEADRTSLTSFASLASLMIERSWTMEKYSALEQLSITDPLTGLYNQRLLRKRLEEEISRSTRCGSSISVIFMDLDFFKTYNDICGHLAGDRALQKTADIVKAFVRDMDIVIRYGGEEFCIILPDTTKNEAIVVAERIRQEIEKEEFSCEENLPSWCLTASFGIASFPEDGQTFTSLIHSADMCMYRAKAEGRNRVLSRIPVSPVKDESATKI